MQASKQIWLPGESPVRRGTDWIVFERHFELSAVAKHNAFRLFASSRYRLIVNGQIVGYGPARFVPSNAEYASYDLLPFLVIGTNSIIVEACWIDSSSYQHVADTTGRFIAWGTIGAGDTLIDLSTPGQWHARRSEACDTAVPSYSFAIGPVEVRNTRVTPQAWQSPVVIEVDSAWQFFPPSVPRPLVDRITPRLVRSALIKTDETRIGFVSVHPTSRASYEEPVRGQHFRYVTNLHSPREQTIILGLHWGPHFLNGQPLQPTNDPTRGNRQNATVTLNAGWNLLCGEPEQLQVNYPLLIGIPIGSRVTAHATPSKTDPVTMAFQTARRIPEAQRWSAAPPAAFEQASVDRARWQRVEPHSAPAAPARMMAWDVVDAAAQPCPALPLTTTGEHTAVFDVGTEFLGHVQIDIDAPAGTVVDVGYDERLRTDGTIDWYFSNPFIESADRFICCGGRQILETFYPRGGRYIQVTVRVPAGKPPATLNGVTLRDARNSQSYDRPFKSNNALFNWTWEAGIETLRASADDVFCDSPWRERGMYLGDSYVQSMVELVAAKQPHIGQRALRLFAAAQHVNGQLPNVAPSWYSMPLLDFSLIYVLWLHDFWQQTQDLSIVRDCFGAVRRLMTSPTWITSEHSALWNVGDAKMFIDWGVHQPARSYDENAVLNAFRYRALQCAAVLAAAMGYPAQAEQWREQSESVRAAFRERLWLPQHGRFAGGTTNGSPIEREILHGNILALSYGLANEMQEPILAAYVVRGLSENSARALSNPPIDDYAELYFLKFALDALERIGRHDLARQVIIDHMRPMRDAGATTLWETLRRGYAGLGSFCHSWSGGPLLYLAKYENLASTRGASKESVQ